MTNATITHWQVHKNTDTDDLAPSTAHNVSTVDSVSTTNTNDSDSSTTSNTIINVDISIAGTPHRISCPSNEVTTLNRISDDINEALRDIRRAARGKSLNNEALLVLHCLDLYDRIAALQTRLDALSQNHQSANALIDKIIKDTQTVI